MKKMSIVLTLLLLVIAITATTSGFSSADQQGSNGQTSAVLTANSGGPLPAEIVLNSSNGCSAQDMMIATANKAAGSEWTDRNLSVSTTNNQGLPITATTDAIIIAKVQPLADPAVNDSRGSFHTGKMVTSTSAVVIIANQTGDKSQGGGSPVGDMIAFGAIDVNVASIIT
jgi:hypothetical protein